MKSLSVLILSLLTVAAHAAITPMNLVEKSSYRLAAVVKKGEAPAYLSTDLAQIQIHQVALPDGSQGTAVSMISPSLDPNDPNSLTVSFSAEGKIQSQQLHVVSQGSQSPVFTQVDGATLLDLGAEAVVDHLTEDADLPTVAQKAQTIDLVKENGALFLIHLEDGRTYKVQLDLDGNFVSRGF